jgi:hypothetical protein
VKSKTIYVPEASINKYKSTYGWRDFGKILPISTTGIQTVNKGDVKITMVNGMLQLNNVPEDEPVSVYAVSGQLLGAGKGNISVNAQPGQTVIVKVGNWSRKVMVK